MAETPVPVKKTNSPSIVADPFRSFRAEMDRLFDRFFSGFGWPAVNRPSWMEPSHAFETMFEVAAPNVDVTEDATAYKLSAELPGLAEKDIEVSVSGGMLTVKGEKHKEKEEKDKRHWVKERSYGTFQRLFSLPDSVDADKASAQFSKGVLTITLPKKPEAQKAAKKIEVKSA
jgi:HSP20 family protein